MKALALFLMIFWLIVIAYPEFLAYLIGWFFVFIWLNMLLMGFVFPSKKKESFVKFGSYKIFRD